MNLKRILLITILLSLFSLMPFITKAAQPSIQEKINGLIQQITALMKQMSQFLPAQLYQTYGQQPQANQSNSSPIAVASVQDFALDHIIVKFKPGYQPDQAFATQYHATSARKLLSQGIISDSAITYGLDRLYLVNLPPSSNASSAITTIITALNDNPNVEYAVPDHVVNATLIPNDTSFNQQWGLNNTSTPGADIHAPAAWETTTGTNKVIAAVIDTGVDYNHSDLAANIWTNTGEIPGNGIDDDHDGYVDDVHGYDFVNNDGDPMDDNSHGTHVAGVIGAVSNNGFGVAGVDWNVKIMACKFLNASGSGSTSNAINCLNFVLAHGVSVSNNSWGGGGYNLALHDSINSARAKGHIFVAAAGNSGSNNDITPFYPASYDLNNLIAVAATDSNDNMASYSNYGATSVDLAAPGSNIYSTLPSNSYGNKSGTSMATPFVTGVVAMIQDLHPDWTYSQVINQVFGTVDVLPSLTNKVYADGRLNLKNALGPETQNDTTPPAASITSPSSGTTYTSAQTVTILASASDNVGVTRVEFYDGGTLIYTTTYSPYTYNWSFTSLDNRTHSWTAKAYDAVGKSSSSNPVSLTVNISTPDTISPTVSISGPSVVIKNNKTFTATASDNVGVSKVEFYLDNNSSPFIIDYSAPYTAAVILNGKGEISSGSHTIKAKAYDLVGNTASAQMTFTK